MTNTPIDVEALEALEAAATPAPWELNADNASYIQIRKKGRIYLRVANGKDRQTAAFIVALRNAAPELIKRVQRAEELADKYKWQVLDTCTRAEKAESSIASLRGLLAEAGEALKPFATVNFSFDGYSCEMAQVILDREYLGTVRSTQDHAKLSGLVGRAAAILVSIQTALRDASPKTEPHHD